MKVAWGASSHVGMVRQQNEDAYIAQNTVFAVADGMGGHNAGEVASSLAIAGLRDAALANFTSAEALVAAINAANATIHQASGGPSEQRGMGTTLAALAPLAATESEPQRVVVANVGDSRAYLWRSDELKQVSADHSYVQELLSEGLITADEARVHPRRNIVTRALGIEGDVTADSWVLPMIVGDRYILCSDGLVDEVDDERIAALLRTTTDPQVVAERLVQMANDNGGRDNVTVVVVDIIADSVADATTPPTTPAPKTSQLRRLVAAAFVVVLGLGGVAAIGWYARDGYFVGFDGRDDQSHLVIYQGKTRRILWFAPTVKFDSGVKRGDVFPALADDLDDKPRYTSFAKAKAYVSSISDVIAAQAPESTTGP